MQNRCRCGKMKARRYAACSSCWGKLSKEEKKARENNKGTLRRYA